MVADLRSAGLDAVHAREDQPVEVGDPVDRRVNRVPVLRREDADQRQQDRLGAEFELGSKGSLQLQTGGDLYLRCRNAWNELAGDAGRISVKFQLPGQDPSLCEASD